MFPEHRSTAMRALDVPCVMVLYDFVAYQALVFAHEERSYIEQYNDFSLLFSVTHLIP